MNKINIQLQKLLLILVLSTFPILKGQVGIGTTTPRGGLDINKPTTNIYGLVLPTNAQPSNMQNPQGGNVPAGTIMYDSTEDCVKLYKQSLNGGAPGWSDCLQSGTASSVVADCNAVGNGFNGAYKKGTAMAAGNTFKVTLTNNSFSQASITLAATDLTLSGISGITVASVSPTTATLNAGASQVVTYTLSGNPTVCGTLTGTWQKISLNCTKTTDVAPNPTFDCANGSWSTAVSPEYRLNGLMNGQVYTGTYSVAYTGGECSLPSETLTSNGLTFSFAGGSLSPAGTINYQLSGTYTGANNGAVTFTTASGCTIYLGSCASCKELLAQVPGTPDGVYSVNLNKAGTPDITQVYCDMTTDGGGWALVSVNGTDFTTQTQKTVITGLNDNGYLPRTTVIKVANIGTQVQLRAGASATVYANKITSQPGGAGILALRDPSAVNMGLGTWHRTGAVADFTGNTTIPPVGTWLWTVTCGPTSMTGWPRMYHSCGNATNVHWFMDTTSSNRTAGGEPWASTWIR